MVKFNRLKRSGTAALAILSVVLGCGVAVAQTQKWEFQVFLDDTPVGHHHFTVRDAGAERELTTDARFDVRFLFINAYRYVHSASETWRNNCLSGLTARTDDNGTLSTVNALRQGDRMTITATSGRESIDGCVMSFAYWNPAILRQTRLLNAQTGKYEAVTITAIGEETIVVRGAPLPAKRYRIAGAKHPIDLWYGNDQSWVALQSTLEGGRKLRYQSK